MTHDGYYQLPSVTTRHLRANNDARRLLSVTTSKHLREDYDARRLLSVTTSKHLREDYDARRLLARVEQELRVLEPRRGVLRRGRAFCAKKKLSVRYHLRSPFLLLLLLLLPLFLPLHLVASSTKRRVYILKDIIRPH